MSLKAKVIGLGQAGNKAVITLFQNGVVSYNDCLLINTTKKDIPEKFRDNAIKLQGSDGCAKERSRASQITMENLKDGALTFIDGFMEADDSMVIICASAEGGTGCGASTVLAKYFKDVLDKNVHMFVFGGFEEDLRGLKNTVDWFKDHQNDYTVEAVCNKKFLDECNGNKRKAEQAANEEFAERIKILLGNEIVESENNIDDEDLLKVATTPGFMCIEHGDIGKPKNIEEYNKIVSDIIDNTKSYDVDPTGLRIAVILNIKDKNADNIDYNHTVIKDKFAQHPFEVCTHIQSVEELGNKISIIVAGLKMPLDEINDIYNNFKEGTDKVDTSKDDFFSMKFDTDTSAFDLKRNDISAEVISKNRAAFFGGSSDLKPAAKPASGKFQNIRKSDEV